jgi:hypothetical protein
VQASKFYDWRERYGRGYEHDGWIPRDFRLAPCLHSAIAYVTPHDRLAGRKVEIHTARDRKVEETRRQWQLWRTAASMLAHSSNAATITLQVEQITTGDATNAEG